MAAKQKRARKRPDDSASFSSDVTIRDIARALDISHTTVSRALADHPHISPETKERVGNKARQLGYVAHGSARAMRGAPSPLIGLMVPDIENDFYASVAKIVADSLAARSMQLLLSISEDDPDRELRELRGLLQARPSGLIVVPTASPRDETAQLLRKIRAVELIRTLNHPDSSAVVIDDRAGVHMATRHLLDYGHRKLSYIGGAEQLSTGRQRLSGFREALAEFGVSSAAEFLGPPRAEFARQAVASLIARSPRPTALVLGSSELTLGALQALRVERLNFPADLSIVGYHDPGWFALAGDGITTVRLPVKEIALTATKLLHEKLKGGSEETSTRATMRFSPMLVVRGSTGPLGK